MNENKKSLYAIVLFLFIGFALIQSKRSSTPLDITKNELMNHIRYLSHEKREGRYPGSRGSKDAISYIVKKFKSYGVQPGANNSFIQSFNIKTGIQLEDSNFIKINNDSYLPTLILQRMVMQQEIKFEEAEEFYNNFTEIIKKTKSAIEIKKNIESIKESLKESPTIGSLAPKFSGPSLDGTSIALDDVKSKVIMIDFWASWCAPCRVENPFLVYLNTKYNTDQFQVVGVSLDREREKWVSAIETDFLDNWIHVSNLKFWAEPIGKLYNVRQMPTTFILDENKRVIGMNLKGKELDKLISKQLSL